MRMRIERLGSRAYPFRPSPRHSAADHGSPVTTAYRTAPKTCFGCCRASSGFAALAPKKRREHPDFAATVTAFMPANCCRWPATVGGRCQRHPSVSMKSLKRGSRRRRRDVVRLARVSNRSIANFSDLADVDRPQSYRRVRSHRRLLRRHQVREAASSDSAKARQPRYRPWQPLPLVTLKASSLGCWRHPALCRYARSAASPNLVQVPWAPALPREPQWHANPCGATVPRSDCPLHSRKQGGIRLTQRQRARLAGAQPVLLFVVSSAAVVSRSLTRQERPSSRPLDAVELRAVTFPAPMPARYAASTTHCWLSQVGYHLAARLGAS